MNIKPNKIDYLIVAALLTFSVFIFLSWTVFRNKGSKVVIITPDKKFVYPLKGKKIVIVKGKNYKQEILITDKGAKFIHSKCPLKQCEKFGFVNKNGMSAVCIPNQVIIRVISGKNNVKVDTICR